MDTSLHPASSVSPSIHWSLYAGLYMFICGTVTALLLNDLLGLLGDVIGLPPVFSLVIFASPALVVGTVVWWALVERRTSYTYLVGGTFGLITALLTGLLWTVRFVSVWGVEMLAAEIILVLVGFVLGMITIAGVLTGLPLMYARRRLDRRLSGGTERAN